MCRLLICHILSKRNDKKFAIKITGFQNTVCYKDKPENMAYRLRLVHCILLPFAGLLICHNIRTTAKEEYNHGSPAEQIRRHIHFQVCLMRFHTNRWHYGSFHAPENIFRFHSIIPLLEYQSSYCAEAPSMQIVPDPCGNSSLRRQNMLLFYFLSTRPLRAETVLTRKQLLHIVRDSITLSHNNIAAAVPESFRPQSFSGIFSGSGQDCRRLFFYGKSQYRNKLSCRLAELLHEPRQSNDIAHNSESIFP